jgi:cytochrome c oxidase subunit 7
MILIWTLLEPPGYHVPAVRRRDMFYAKLEDQRAEALGQI